MKLIKLLIFLVVVVGVVGYFKGWYEVKKEGDDTFQVKINKDKAKEDIGKVTEKIKDLGAGRKEVTGKIKTVNILTGNLEITTEGNETMAFKLDKSILEGGVADMTTIGAMAAGESVTIKFEEKDGQKRILKVTKS